MYLAQKTNLDLSPSYVEAWLKCLPSDFQAKFPNDSIPVKSEIADLFHEDADSEKVIIDLTASKNVEMGKSQAFMCLTWLMENEDTNIKPLMDIPIFRDTIATLVKDVVGPRIARGIITRNYDKLEEMSREIEVGPAREAPQPSSPGNMGR